MKESDLRENSESIQQQLARCPFFPKKTGKKKELDRTTASLGLRLEEEQEGEGIRSPTKSNFSLPSILLIRLEIWWWGGPEDQGLPVLNVSGRVVFGEESYK